MNLYRKSKTRIAQEDITQWLIDLRGYPFNPASGFDVTAIFCSQVPNDDNYYYFAGVNVENSDHRLSTHAEEACIASMVTAFGKNADIVEGWVMGAPKALKPGSSDPLANNKVSCCGKCRQQIVGLADASVKIHSVSLNGEIESTTVKDFLPNPFSFRQFIAELIDKLTTTVAQAFGTAEQSLTQLPLEMKSFEYQLIRSQELSERDIFEWLTKLESVDYASQSSHAAVLKLSNGSYVAGVNIEEAAFVSINPIQSAIATASTAFKEVEVIEVWTYSKHKQSFSAAMSKPNLTNDQDDKSVSTAFRQLTSAIPYIDETFTALPLSAIQVLGQFAPNTIKINMFNAAGKTKAITMHESAREFPAYHRPNIVKPRALPSEVSYFLEVTPSPVFKN